MKCRLFRVLAKIVPALLLNSCICIAPSSDVAAPLKVEVSELTIARIHSGMRAGKFSAEELVRTYVAEILHNERATKLNAIRVINEQAIRAARQLDEEFSETGQLRPLHGIPIIVKDNIDVSGHPTTAGSLAMQWSRPPDDAFIIRRLRDAGAIVLAKSNMAEWAFSPLQTVGSIHGVTRNPYDLSRVPAGSSGGTAAAIAANYGAVGLGTDTGNSVRGPSSHTALVGHRPSLGLVSRDGIVPLFLHYDTAGPMCRTVEDAARLLDVIVGYDAADPLTRHAERIESGAFVEALQLDGLEGVRIGALRTLFNKDNAHPEVLRLMQQALADLRAAGAMVVDVDIPLLNESQESLKCNTFRHDVNGYLKSLDESAPFSDVAHVFDDSRLYAPYLHDQIRDSVAISIEPADRTPPCLDVDADTRRIQFAGYVLSVMDEADIDALVFPTWSYPPRKLWDSDTPHGNNSFQIAPHIGSPAITVPMGFTGTGLPAGLQFVGRRFSDVALISYAYAYEQRTLHRQPPKLSTIESKPGTDKVSETPCMDSWNSGTLEVQRPCEEPKRR